MVVKETAITLTFDEMYHLRQHCTLNNLDFEKMCAETLKEKIERIKSNA